MKCFLWCHIRHLNPLKIHPERITNVEKNMVHDLDYEGKYFSKINNIFIHVFCYENDLVYPVHISNPRLENCMDLLMRADQNKSHYVYI